jgi:serine phosphatase RsbU (regulator of sigma subunit)
MQMEESRHARLCRNLEALQADLALAQDTRQQGEQLAGAAQQFVAEQHRRMAQEEAELQGEAERRAALLGVQRAAAEEAAANEQRRQRLQEVQERVARLRVSRPATLLALCGTAAARPVNSAALISCNRP